MLTVLAAAGLGGQEVRQIQAAREGLAYWSRASCGGRNPIGWCSSCSGMSSLLS